MKKVLKITMSLMLLLVTVLSMNALTVNAQEVTSDEMSKEITMQIVPRAMNYTSCVKWSASGPVVNYTIDITSKSNYVGYGYTNKERVVKFLQGCLNKAGFKDNAGRKLVVDGIFGSSTFEAIKNFQSYKGTVEVSVVDGIFGEASWSALLSWHLPSTYITKDNPILCY